MTSVLATGSCSEKDDDDKDETETTVSSTPSVTPSTEGTLSMSGSLAISGTTLADTETGLLAYKMIGTNVAGAPEEIELAADLSFTYDVERSAEALEIAKTAVDSGEIEDDQFAAIAAVMGVTEDQLKEYYSQDAAGVIGAVEEQIGFAEVQGSSAILIAYDKSGDKVEEAKSFRFIGMTAEDSLLSLLPVGDLIGNVSLGAVAVTSDSDDAVSELEAGDAVDIDAADLRSMAQADDVLKAVRNNYMNTAWKAEPFFLWLSDVDALSAVESDFSLPTAQEYQGAGFYVGAQTDTSFTYEEICHATEGSRKILEFVAPSKVTLVVGQEEKRVTTISNAGTVSGETQGENRVCMGSTTGFYAREDAENRFMLNYGAGGALQGDIPAGIWTLNIDGEKAGSFDLASAKPFDADDKPRVFIPAIKMTKSGGNYTGMSVKLYSWTGSEFEAITDFTAVQRLTRDWDFTVTTISDNQEMGRDDEVVFGDDGVMSVEYSDPASATDVRALSVSYVIGSSTFRFEIR